jgi:PAS domain S-box-containing protein
MGVYRPRSKDRAWLLVNAEPELDSNGQILFVTCTFNNISGQVNALSRLRKNEAQFRELFESSPIGISLTKTNHRLFVNQAFCEITGFTKEELNIMTWMDITHPDDIDITNDALNAARRQSGKQLEFRKRYIHKNGSIIHAEKWLVFNEDTQSYIANFIDITEKKQAEEKMIQLNVQLKNTTEELSELSHHMQNLIEKERSELAKEIHDEFAQKFAAINMNAELIRKKLKNTNSDIDNLINEQILLSQEVIKSSEILFNSLYPTMLQDVGLIAAVESYINGSLKFVNFKLPLQTNIRDEIFSKEVNLVLYRIFIESMSNILLYAKASRVIVNIHKADKHIIMAIIDDGIGFDINEVNKKEQHGLLVIRERTYAIKGKFNIHSSPGEGTKIEISIPLGE